MNSHKQLKLTKVNGIVPVSPKQEDLIDEHIFHFGANNQIVINGIDLKVQGDPSWSYVNSSGTYWSDSVLINNKIILVRRKGKMSPADADATFGIVKKIVEKANTTKLFFIDHIGKLAPLSRETRKKVTHYFTELKCHWIQTYQVLPKKHYIAYLLFKDLQNENIIFTQSIKETLSICLGKMAVVTASAEENVAEQQEVDIPFLQKLKRPELIETVMQLQEEKKQLNDYISHRVDYLTKVIGLSIWNDDFTIQQPVLNQSDSFAGLFDAIALILSDLKEGINKQNAIKHLMDSIEPAEGEKLNIIFNNVGDVVYSVNDEGIITFISPSVADQLGYHPNELLGKSIFRFIHPDDTSNFLLSSDKNFFLRNHQKIDYRILKKSRTYTWMEAYSNPVYDDNGNIVSVIISSRENNEKKLLQENLNNKEEELRSTMEAMSESVYVFDNNGVLVTSNQKKNKDHFIEGDIEDLIGKTYHEIFSESFVKKLGKTIRLLYTSGLKHEFEYMAENNVSNREYDIYKICLLARKNNIKNFAGITMIARNITAEKKLKEQNAELEKTNEELDRFVYSASHDLRAPLASTLGLINVSRITSEDQEKMKYLDLMEASLQKMDRYIHDITDYSRNARQSIEFEKIEFNEIIEDVKQSLSYHENVSKIDFLVYIDNKVPFYTDYSRLNIILRNILSNSIKYHDLSRSHPFVSIDVKTSEHEAVISLEDNGIGIDPKYQDKIFNMFFQASPEAFGSGLGLYIVREAINKLGGRVKVKSALKEGSKFTVYLPNQTHRQGKTSNSKP